MDYLRLINIETIIEDPMLMLGVFLLIIGPVFFLVGLWKFIQAKNEGQLIVPQNEPVEPPSPAPNEQAIFPEPTAENEIADDKNKVVAPLVSEQIKIELDKTIQPKKDTVQLSVISEEKPSKTISIDKTMDQTVIMPPGVADLQAQMEILVAQIKQLNKKSIDLEESVEQLTKQLATKLDSNDLKSSPQNPEEFMNKLLKLAEHVIALEKDMAKIKSQAPKAPIMPL